MDHTNIVACCGDGTQQSAVCIRCIALSAAPVSVTKWLSCSAQALSGIHKPRKHHTMLYKVAPQEERVQNRSCNQLSQVTIVRQTIVCLLFCTRYRWQCCAQQVLWIPVMVVKMLFPKIVQIRLSKSPKTVNLFIYRESFYVLLGQSWKILHNCNKKKCWSQRLTQRYAALASLLPEIFGGESVIK